MKLIEGFPTPSFHMGMLTMMSGIEDIILVEFGAEGTMLAFTDALHLMGCESKAKMFTSRMDEASVVLGSYDRLKKTLIELDQEYRPEFIFVTDSTISTIIGGDIRGALTMFEELVNARLIALVENNLNKSFSAGLEYGKKILIDNDIVSKEEVDKAYQRALKLRDYFISGKYKPKLLLT